MRPRHAWTVLAERALIDRDSNNISLDVLEQVNAIGVTGPGTVVPMSFEVDSLWYRLNDDELTGHARLRVFDPAGVEAPSHPITLDLTQHRRLRTRMRFLGLSVSTSGTYLFVVESQSPDGEWDEVARIPLEVAVIPAAGEVNTGAESVGPTP